ncbi:MAG: Jag N-terminal domain-containing protein [Chloroflexi bacterium]|nr:Jag N-terminal domain-containing protein [Chloroflexota bacterium]
MSAYQEFTGKTVEEALRAARETFGVGLADLDFEILTPGSRGVLGMGAELARIVAAPRSELGGAAPKREAAEAKPLPPPPPREGRDDRPDRGGFRDRQDRGAFRERGPRRDDAPPGAGAPGVGVEAPAEGGERAERPERSDRPDRGAFRDRGPRRDDRPRGPRRDDRAGPRPERRDDRPRRAPADLTETEAAEVAAARGSLASERADLEAAEASPEALAAGKAILEALMSHLEFDVRVDVESGETSRLNIVGDEKEALGALIGRKGERLSALQHLVNLMLSKQMGGWTRVLVDVEDYRGRRERQLREIALRAAQRVTETGRMLQLEPMPALERRWIHLALREHPDVATQSIGEEPNRRIVLVPRGG